MLTVTDLKVRINRLPILRGITLTVPDRTIVGLVGRNGAGKTTTLRSVMGLLRASSGTVTLDGADLLRERPYHRVRHGIGYVPEDRRLVPELSVEENLLLPIWANRIPDGRERLARVYERMPLMREFGPRRATSLSGGQQKLAAVARALMVGRTVLLLDEPFEGLAPALAERVADAIRATRDEDGVAVLIAESEYSHVQRLAERVYTIERGEISDERDIEEGTRGRREQRRPPGDNNRSGGSR